mmetsp:Transcript_55850/g.125992  ORF Transcript_55850/g.125992 Transcript_55850/m.125992 type:complete len:241 (-) Transcript_55850:622-1344(-)
MGTSAALDLAIFAIARAAFPKASTLPFWVVASVAAVMASSMSPLARWAVTSTTYASPVALSSPLRDTSALPVAAASTAFSRSPSVWWQVTMSFSASASRCAVFAEAFASVATCMASSSRFMLTRILNLALVASKAANGSALEATSLQAWIASSRVSTSFMLAFSMYLVTADMMPSVSPDSCALLRAFLKATSALDGPDGLTGVGSGLGASGLNLRSLLRCTSGGACASRTGLQPTDHRLL